MLGGVRERLKRAVLKTARAQVLEGSNPSPSAGDLYPKKWTRGTDQDVEKYIRTYIRPYILLDTAYDIIYAQTNEDGIT
jgi:hypothetical protein